jgi:hypothetical protein
MNNTEDILYISDVKSYDDKKIITIITKKENIIVINKKLFSFYLNNDFIICKKIKNIVNNTKNSIIYINKKDTIIEKNKANIRNIKLNNILKKDE